MITVWGRRNSVNVQKVLWALGTIEAPAERRLHVSSESTYCARRGCAPDGAPL